MLDGLKNENSNVYNMDLRRHSLNKAQNMDATKRQTTELKDRHIYIENINNNKNHSKVIRQLATRKKWGKTVYSIHHHKMANTHVGEVVG